METILDRHRGTLVMATGFAIALLFLASVIGAFTIDESSPSSDEVIDASSSGTVDTSPILPPIDLAPLISPAPAGFDKAAAALDGPVTRDQMAQERGNATSALALFDKLGLLGGFVRTYQRTGGDDLVAVRLYQFGRASGATRYVEQGVDNRMTPKAKRFEVTGVADAVGIDAGIDDSGRHLAFVFVPRGRVVLVVAASFKEPADFEVLKAVTRAQAALLP